jgi:hypothetical protein
MCPTHWHKSAQIAPEWGIIIEVADILAKMEPPDLQMCLSLPWSLPLPALAIASQMWEPALVQTFCAEVKKAAAQRRDWQKKAAPRYSWWHVTRQSHTRTA